jgi:hypothetical protein
MKYLLLHIVSHTMTDFILAESLSCTSKAGLDALEPNLAKYIFCNYIAVFNPLGPRKVSMSDVLFC